MAFSLFPRSTISDRTGYNAAMQIIKRVGNFYRDPEYFSEVRRLALPIMAQQFMFSLLNMVGVVFVGQKGETAVAAVGLAGQASFLLNLVNFGDGERRGHVHRAILGKARPVQFAPRAGHEFGIGIAGCVDFSFRFAIRARSVS